MHATRNLRLCSKDCMCLYVCPTGATDTENGQIDFSKCLEGCRLCVDACPSHAISLIPDNYAPQQPKSGSVRKALSELSASKAEQEKIAASIAEASADPIAKQLARAVEKSSRLISEECMRESGFMLPQSQETKQLLQALLDAPQPDGFPKDCVARLIETL